MISAALPPRNAPLGGNRAPMSNQALGDDKSPFPIETDDPSCISFSENIDESPNRRKHFNYEKSGALLSPPMIHNQTHEQHVKVYEFNYNEQ